MRVDYIDRHRGKFGVQPICEALEGTDAEIAPSTYYAARSRPALGPSRTRHRPDQGDHRDNIRSAVSVCGGEVACGRAQSWPCAGAVEETGGSGEHSLGAH